MAFSTSDKIFYIVITLFILLIFWTSVTVLSQELHYTRTLYNGQVALGEVTDFKEVLNTDTRGRNIITTKLPIITFKDQQSKIYLFVHKRNLIEMSSYAVGKKVTVIYDPKEPKGMAFVIDNTQAILRIFLALILLLTGISIGWRFFFKKDNA